MAQSNWRWISEDHPKGWRSVGTNMAPPPKIISRCLPASSEGSSLLERWRSSPYALCVLTTNFQRVPIVILVGLCLNENTAKRKKEKRNQIRDDARGSSVSIKFP